MTRFLAAAAFALTVSLIVTASCAFSYCPDNPNGWCSDQLYRRMYAVHGKMAKMKGKTGDEVIAEWGQPSAIVEGENGGKLMVYLFLPRPDGGGFFSWPSATGGGSARMDPESARTSRTFFLNGQGTVYRWAWRGFEGCLDCEGDSATGYKAGRGFTKENARSEEPPAAGTIRLTYDAEAVRSCELLGNLTDEKMNVTPDPLGQLSSVDRARDASRVERMMKEETATLGGNTLLVIVTDYPHAMGKAYLCPILSEHKAAAEQKSGVDAEQKPRTDAWMARRDRAEAIRVTKNTEAVRGCRFLKNVTAKSGTTVRPKNLTPEEHAATEALWSLRYQTLDLGGNVLVIVTDYPNAMGEAYLCSEK